MRANKQVLPNRAPIVADSILLSICEAISGMTTPKSQPSYDPVGLLLRSPSIWLRIAIFVFLLVVTSFQAFVLDAKIPSFMEPHLASDLGTALSHFATGLYSGLPVPKELAQIAILVLSALTFLVGTSVIVSLIPPVRLYARLIDLLAAICAAFVWCVLYSIFQALNIGNVVISDGFITYSFRDPVMVGPGFEMLTIAALLLVLLFVGSHMASH